jgi:hypothetical protein
MDGKDKRDENIKAIRRVFIGFRKHEDGIVVVLDGDAREEKLSTDGLRVEYIGKQDLEDCFPPRVWMSVLNQVGLGDMTDEGNIKEVLDAVSKGKVDKNKKFLESMRTHLVNEAKDDDQKQLIIANYPRKGKILAAYLSKSIENRDDIPQDISKALC